MKQRITPDQLDQIDVEGKSRIRRWYVKERRFRHGDLLTYADADNRGWEDGHKLILVTWGRTPDYFHCVGGRVRPKLVLPLLSIGQMIEFLEDHHALSQINPPSGASSLI